MVEDAEQAAILRSGFKDSIQTNSIKSSLASIVQSFFGPRFWIKWQNELHVLADLGYFTLTTFAGLQTLGEEYVNIILVKHSRRAVPSVWRRGAMVALQILLPYILDRGLSLLEQQVHQNVDISLEVKTRLLDAIPLVKHIITILQRCHLAAFYLNGLFYHLAKRVTAIYYVMVRKQTGSNTGRNYRLLGWLAVLQLTLLIAHQCYKTSTSQPPTSPCQPSLSINMEHQLSTDNKCSLCLEFCNQTTATPCGHLFCWHCIMEWCTVKSQCPLCREKVTPSRLIYLHNYR